MNSLRILIVDDNDDHRFLTRRAVRSLHDKFALSIEAARDGDEALKRLRDPDAERLDLVLLDLKMPHVDGIEVLEALGQPRTDPRTRIIMFTSSEHESDRTRALAAGADAFVTKPITADAFHRCVQDTVLAWAPKATSDI